MSITLEQAKRLQAAGYGGGSWYIHTFPYANGIVCYHVTGPQGQRHFTDDRDYPTERDYRSREDAEKATLDFPNSDELIAAIQERWPDVEWGVTRFTDGWTAAARTLRHWSTGNIQCRAATLLDALVDLYCKLAEAQP